MKYFQKDMAPVLISFPQHKPETLSLHTLKAYLYRNLKSIKV